MKVGRKRHRQKNDERQVRGGRTVRVKGKEREKGRFEEEEGRVEGEEGRVEGRGGKGMYLVVHGNGVLGVEGEHEGAAEVGKNKK